MLSPSRHRHQAVFHSVLPIHVAKYSRVDDFFPAGGMLFGIIDRQQGDCHPYRQLDEQAIEDTPDKTHETFSAQARVFNRGVLKKRRAFYGIPRSAPFYSVLVREAKS